jgi:hypothetical protein
MDQKCSRFGLQKHVFEERKEQEPKWTHFGMSQTTK